MLPTLSWWKVPEESRLVYRSSTSALECCCLAGNDEFLSGSDDGSIELWSVLRKKPVSIVKNAHTLSALKKQVDLNYNGTMSNGHIGKNNLIFVCIGYMELCSILVLYVCWVYGVMVTKYTCSNGSLVGMAYFKFHLKCFIWTYVNLSCNELSSPSF